MRWYSSGQSSDLQGGVTGCWLHIWHIFKIIVISYEYIIYINCLLMLIANLVGLLSSRSTIGRWMKESMWDLFWVHTCTACLLFLHIELNIWCQQCAQWACFICAAPLLSWLISEITAISSALKVLCFANQT